LIVIPGQTLLQGLNALNELVIKGWSKLSNSSVSLKDNRSLVNRKDAVGNEKDVRTSWLIRTAVEAELALYSAIILRIAFLRMTS